MREDLIDNIREALSREFIMRSMVKYFMEHGFKRNFDVHIYPPALQDIVKSVPALADKVEVVPHVEGINPQEGLVRLGWNLFVLGNKRMYLGETSHKNLTELKSPPCASPSGLVVKSSATPRKIIKFVVRVLTDEHELVQPSAGPSPMTPLMRPRSGPVWSGGFYEKRRPVL